MATRQTSKRADQPRSRTRPYIVVRRDGEKLTVIDPQREAVNHDAAMSAVLANEKPENRNVVLGAFPAAGYREMEFKTEQTFVTSKTKRKAAFGQNGTPASVASPPVGG